MVFCTASDCNGGHGTFDQSTSEAFWRGKDTDADGSWRRAKMPFSVMKMVT